MRRMALHLAILSGGTSSEREVALASAASVKAAIGDRARVSLFDVPAELDAFLNNRATIDCVLPIFHGRGGEDGTIQGFLETLGMPYTFSRVAANALAIDKPKTNTVVAAAGVRVPHGSVVRSGESHGWTRNVVIKPIDGGSSVGISIAHNQAELNTGLLAAAKWSSQIMVEEYIEGREYSVAVIDVAGKAEALPVISIESQHEFFDYQSKYEPGIAEEVCPADIPEELAERLRSAATQVHSIIGARQVSRSDFIVDAQGAIWFLEINTIPGMSVLLPKAIRAAGRDFGEVLMGWVNDAIGQQTA